MGKNNKERLVFTILMCTLMVFGMSLYNLILNEGFSPELVLNLIKGYLPGFAVALILDIYVVGRFAKGLLGRLTTANDHPAKKIVLMSFFMVMGMVFFMSFYGAVVNVGFSAELPHAYLAGLVHNFIFALPLQLVIVGPIVRIIFIKIFPQINVVTSN